MLKRRNKKKKKNNKKKKESNPNSLFALMAVVMLLVAFLNQLIQSDRIDELIEQQGIISKDIKIKDELIVEQERRFGMIFEENKELIASAFYGEDEWEQIEAPRTVEWEGK